AHAPRRALPSFPTRRSSDLFLSHRDGAVAGTAVTVVVEGKRPLLGEVQALVADSALANPRRAVSGLDSSRVAMILAVQPAHCPRSEEHTSELQSRSELVCRL